MAGREAAGGSRGARPKLRPLELCLAELGNDRVTYKLEALEAWLSDREPASLCVAAIGDERRCSINAHARDFGGVSQISAGRGAWWAAWCAIAAAVARVEEFERAGGADVG